MLDDMAVAVEVKASSRVHDGDLRGLHALDDEQRVRHKIVVCLEAEPRTVATAIEILPWRVFVARPWDGELGV